MPFKRVLNVLTLFHHFSFLNSTFPCILSPCLLLLLGALIHRLVVWNTAISVLNHNLYAPLLRTMLFVCNVWVVAWVVDSGLGSGWYSKYSYTTLNTTSSAS